MKNNKKIVVLDICMSDYFSGYHKTVIQVPVYKKQLTNAEAAQEIENEINLLWELMKETHTPEELEIWDRYTEELKGIPDKIFFSDPEINEDNEEEECAYIFLGLINPVTVHGLTFLNP